MAATLTPQYLEAEAEYKKAQTAEERLACLKKMYSLLPKHKASEKLQAELKTKISETKDEVEQLTASLGYGLAWRDRLQVRLAAHRTRYDKQVMSTGGVRTEGVSETTLYNASAIVSLTDRTAVFGSWVTGAGCPMRAPACR